MRHRKNIYEQKQNKTMNHDTCQDKDCNEGLGYMTEQDALAPDKGRHRLCNT